MLTHTLLKHTQQVGEEILRWAMSTPNQVAPLSEVIKMHNRLSSDALTYQVRGLVCGFAAVCVCISTQCVKLCEGRRFFLIG